MAIKTKDELKALFETGDKPTQQDFIDLFDSLVGKNEQIVSNTWQPPNSPVYMGTGQELTMTHPTIVNENYSISVAQEIPGEAGQTNISLDFSVGTNGNYIQEDESKIEFIGGVVRLEAGLIPDPANYINITGQHLNPTASSYYPNIRNDGGPGLPELAFYTTRQGYGIAWFSYTGSMTQWLQWNYASPKRLGKFTIQSDSAYGDSFNRLELIGSNNGVDWIMVKDITSSMIGGDWSTVRYVSIPEGEQVVYQYYRLVFSLLSTSKYVNISALNFYENAAYPTDQGYYITTSDNSHFSMTQASKIESLTVTKSEPVGTVIKCLASFDGRQTWVTFNGSSWVSADLNDIAATGCSVTQLQNGFLNLEAEGKEFIDLAFDLYTTTTASTPSVDQVTIIYTDNSHYEMATVGAYTSSSDFGLKRVDPTTTLLKRLNDNPGKVFVTMTIN